MARKKTKNRVLKLKEGKVASGFWCCYVVMFLAVLLRIFIPMQNSVLSEVEMLYINDILSRDFWGLFNPLTSLQMVPPLFSCLIKLCTFYENVALTDFSFRLIPLLASIASIFAFYYLLRNLFVNRAVVLLGLILFAFNPVLITSSQILKPYSMDVLVTVCLLIYFVRYNPEGYWRQFLQILLLCCSMLFSLPSIFTLLGGISWILVKDYRKFFYAITAFILFIVFYFVYHLWNIMEIHGAMFDKYWTNYFVVSSNLFLLSLNFVKENFVFLINPLIGLCIAGVAYLFAWYSDKKFAFITLVSISTLIITSYLHLYPFAPNYTLFLIPYIVIILCEIPNTVISFIKSR